MLQISVKPVKSSLDGIKLFEVFNKTNLNKLINSNVLNTTPWNNFDNEKQQLEDYRNQSVNYEFLGNIDNYGIVPVKYKRVNGYSFGRVYPIKSLSLCTIRREIRHTIGNDIYIDIDISNCHPELIYQTCKHHNIKCDILEDYVINRDTKLEEVQAKYNVSREKAKKLFIILLYFGSFNTWVKELNVDNNISPTEFITKFINERNVYGKAIEDANEDIYLEVQANKTKKNQFEYNEMASVVSIWCQEIENRILETIYKFCLKKKYIKDKLAVLCYDGIMIEISKFKISILDEFTKLIKDTFGYNLKYVQKQLNEGYKLNCILKNNEIENSKYDNDNNYDESDIDESISESLQVNNDTVKNDKIFFKQLEFISHSQMAEKFYGLNSNKYIYSPISGWFKYNQYNVLENTCNNLPIGFSIDISNCLLNYLIPIRNRMKPNSPTYIKDCKNLNKLIRDVSNANYIYGITIFLQDMFINRDIDNKIDNNPNLIAFTNKLFDYSIYSIRDINQNDYICKTTKFEYQPSNKQIRKHILDIIKSIFENKEIENYFLYIKAQSLFGNINENCFIQVGLGGNGKGLLTTIEKPALGDYSMTTENTFLTSVFKQGQANSTLANCKGIRNLIVSEPSDTDELQRETSLNTAFLKLITGNDDVTTRKLYHDNITFKPFFTPYIQCNTLPNLKKIDKGIIRRLQVINFPFMFVDNPTEPFHRKIDRTLKQKFETIEYYREYLLLLLDTIIENRNRNIKIPSLIVSESEKYFYENNPVKIYIDCFIQKKIGSKIKASEIKDHFDNNSDSNISMSLFLKGMKTNGYETVLIHGYRYFKDIEINTRVEIDM